MGRSLLFFNDTATTEIYTLALHDALPISERTPSMELVRITEAAAIASAHWLGHGDNTRADEAAVEAMRRAMDEVAFNATIVIGEGERDEAPMLFIGEKAGRGDGPAGGIPV